MASNLRTGVKTGVLRSALFVFQALSLPFLLFYWCAGRTDGAFQSIMQTACLVPATPGVLLRAALLRGMARRCGLRVTVHLGTLFSSPRIELGEHVYIGAFCNIGYACIEDHVLIGSGVHVLSGKHQHGYARRDIPMALQPGMKSSVRIGHGAWIGNGSIVMADVGEESIIGAGSVVVSAIPPWSIAAGSPARVVGDRRTDSGSTQARVTV